MNEELLTSIVMVRKIARGLTVLPRFCPQNYEMDLAVITKNLYLQEYEMNPSAADYRRDFIAKRGKHGWMEQLYREKKYNQTLNTWSPKNFWFVLAPAVGDVEIPDYAGLIRVQETGCIDIVKKAPDLHRVRLTDRQMLKVSRTLPFKIRTLLEKPYYDFKWARSLSPGGRET